MFIQRDPSTSAGATRSAAVPLPSTEDLSATRSRSDISSTHSAISAQATDTAWSGWKIPEWGATVPAGSEGKTHVSGGAIAGIVVGCTVAIGIMAGIAWLVIRQRRRTRRSSMATLVGEEDGKMSPGRSVDPALDGDSNKSFPMYTRSVRQGSGDTYVEPTTLYHEPLSIDPRQQAIVINTSQFTYRPPVDPAPAYSESDASDVGTR